MEKEIQYMPVGRVRRRRRTWRRTMRDLIRMLMAGGELIVTGILAGAGFGVGLAAVTVFFFCTRNGMGMVRPIRPAQGSGILVFFIKYYRTTHPRMTGHRMHPPRCLRRF